MPKNATHDPGLERIKALLGEGAVAMPHKAAWTAPTLRELDQAPTPLMVNMAGEMTPAPRRVALPVAPMPLDMLTGEPGPMPVEQTSKPARVGPYTTPYDLITDAELETVAGGIMAGCMVFVDTLGCSNAGENGKHIGGGDGGGKDHKAEPIPANAPAPVVPDEAEPDALPDWVHEPPKPDKPSAALPVPVIIPRPVNTGY